MRMIVSVASTAVLLCCACSSSGGGEDGGTTTGDAAVAVLTKHCEALCALGVKCFGSTDVTCQTTCETERKKRVAAIRTDFMEAYTSCLASADCSTTDDDCFLAALKAVNPKFLTGSAYKGCQDRQDQCTKKFSESDCVLLGALNAAATAQFNSCLNQSCDTIKDCLKSLFKS
mgnify:CR=1 FL=1